MFECSYADDTRVIVIQECREPTPCYRCGRQSIGRKVVFGAGPRVEEEHPFAIPDADVCALSLDDVTLPATVAEPRILPTPFRHVVLLGKRVPTFHEKPSQADNTQTNSRLFPGVAQGRQANVHALVQPHRANRQSRVDKESAYTVGPYEGHGRRWRWRCTALCQYCGLRSMAGSLNEMTV